MNSVFISYRRADSQYAVDRIVDSLKHRIPEHRIFVDVHSIPKGEDFEAHIISKLDETDILLAVIGPNWTSYLQYGNERPEKRTKDFVQFEIASALKRGVKVIPLLLDGAQMPSETVLPSELTDLAKRQSISVRRDCFADDIERLFRELGIRKRSQVFKSLFVLAACIAVLLAAFSSDLSKNLFGGGHESDQISLPVVKNEFCRPSNLSPSTRETTLVVHHRDPSSLLAAPFSSSQQRKLLDVIDAFTNPHESIPNGLTAPRERLRVRISSQSSENAVEVFSGCVPGLTDEEYFKLNDESAIQTFLTSDLYSQLREDSESFRISLSAALFATSESDFFEPLTSETIQPSNGTPHLLNAFDISSESTQGVRRVILFTDFSGVFKETFDTESKARESGYADARRFHREFGLADVFVVYSSPPPRFARAYFEALLLAQNAELYSWGPTVPTEVPPAPEKVFYFEGSAEYPLGPETVNITLGFAKDGELTNSWLVLRGSPDRAVPMAGRVLCSGEAECTISSHSSQFAQAWSPDPGGAPEFIDEMPFAGLRDFRFKFENSRLEGEIYDVSVDQVGPDPENTSIKISAQLTHEK